LREVNTLPIDFEGETYYTAIEAARYLSISKDTFYQNVKNRLRSYRLGPFRRGYYRQTDLDAIKRSISPIEDEDRNSEEI
jgi:excisionase family DNA binding protein